METEVHSLEPDLTFERWTNLSQGSDGPSPGVLTSGHLHEEQGQAAKQQHDPIG